MISTDAQMRDLVEALRRSPWIALDTEADSLHSYPEKFCLMQLSHAGGDALVDPLGAASLDPLLEHLGTRELTLHGGGFDLRLLRRATGFVAREIFDTELAARLIGRPHVGLGDLVSEILGIKLEKGSQRANWSQRPLTEKMVAYAHGDTQHLRALRDHLEGELVRLGRLPWHRECCARLIASSVPNPPDPDKAWRIKGSTDLGPRALAALRELWAWREGQAVARNRPPYFVVSHESLVAIALRAGRGAALELPNEVKGSQRPEIEAALARAAAVPESELPAQERTQRPPKPSSEVLARVEAVRKRRDKRAAELGIEQTLIAAKADLFALAERGDEAYADLMEWQQALLRP